MKKVLVCDPIAAEGVKMMEEAGFEVDARKGIPADELEKIVGDYNAVIVRSATKVTEPVIKAGKNLELIARGGVGLDNVDREAAKEAGIKVVNTPEASSRSVAELALAHMLAVARHIPRGTAGMKAGQWEKKKLKGTELMDKTVGIIGIGRIGRTLAGMCNALGMKVVAYDLPEALSSLTEDYIERAASLDDLLAKSDFISLHLPKTPKTANMISSEQFGKMKDGVIIVNCARGGVVDEKALAEALASGKVAGAGIDVFEKEPPEENPFAGMDNVSMTPHIGASTKEGQFRVSLAVAEKVIEHLS